MAPETHHSTSEVGHAVNVAHFQELIAGCESIGATYDPANSRLSITDLNTQLTAAQGALLSVQAAKSELIIEINDRQEAFENLQKLATRIINALTALTSDPRIIADARSIVNKIHGVRARNHVEETVPEEETHHLVSVSQRSYANQIQHFSALIELLRVVPDYAPNEGDLRLTALETYLEQMQTATAPTQILRLRSRTRAPRPATLQPRIRCRRNRQKSQKLFQKRLRRRQPHVQNPQ